MKLSFDKLRQANTLRQAEWCPDQKPDLSFRANEVAGETGEAIERLYDLIAMLSIAAGRVSNVAKKLERERQGWAGSRETIEHLGEELADIVTCADLAAMTVGVDLGAAVVSKFNTVSDKIGLTTKLTDPTEPFKLNKWIDDEVERHAQKDLQFDEDSIFITTDDAAEIARGAAVIVMTDQDTLIGNLTAAGYVVLSPGEQSDILKALTDHNDMLRSTSAVAGRYGRETNWSSFRSRVAEVLASGHQASNLARDATNGHLKTDPSDFKGQ